MSCTFLIDKKEVAGLSNYSMVNVLKHYDDIGYGAVIPTPIEWGGKPFAYRQQDMWQKYAVSYKTRKKWWLFVLTNPTAPNRFIHRTSSLEVA